VALGVAEERGLECFRRMGGADLDRGGSSEGWLGKRGVGGRWAGLRRETETVSVRSPSWRRKQ
jgi:hypothetical protein